MKLNLNIKFEHKKDLVKCIIIANGIEFKSTKRVTKEADRVSEIKRAKQAAYCGAMVKVHGYVCNTLIKDEIQ